MSTVIPHLCCRDGAAAVDFYKRAFNAVEMTRLMTPDGKRLMHAAIKIGGAMVFIADEFPEHGGKSPLLLGGSPVTIHIITPDIDRDFATAIAAGATATMPPADMFWGDRYGRLRDPFGHEWSMSTTQVQLTREQIKANMDKEFTQQQQQ